MESTEQNSLSTKAKPFLKRKITWIVFGVACIITGSSIFYLFEYKHSEVTIITLIGCAFCGWLSMLYSIYPDFFSKNEKTIEMIFLKIITCFLIVGIICININYVINLEKSREKNILTNGPSVITNAKITFIEMRPIKSGTRRYIHIEYSANGETVQQEIPDDKAEFKLIETYRLKYSVRYPEMFEIYNK